MRRYAVSTIIGSGTEDSWYRPALAEYGVNWVVAISADQATNPNKRWVLATIAGTQSQLGAIDADNRCSVLPFGPDQLDNAWTSIGTSQERTRIANRINAMTGIVVQRDDQRTLREIITLLGTTLDSNFSPENLDVRDIT